MIFHKSVITKTLTIMSNIAYCINPLRAPDLCDLGWPLCNICVTNDHGYVPLVVSTIRSFPHSWLITGFVTRLTRWVSLVEKELLTLAEFLSSAPAFSGVRVTRSLFYMKVLLIVVCPLYVFFFLLCFSSKYGFWLPLWYFQTLHPGLLCAFINKNKWKEELFSWCLQVVSSIVDPLIWN